MGSIKPAPSWLIQKKRDGKELDESEINTFIKGVVSGEIPSYQASAFLMAVYFQGMNPSETMALTRSMIESGERYDLSKVKGAKSDKHSTGGVGDKVSIILAPLAAACGLKVPMMAGRGLGHSGGTLDKLEAIQGFQVRPDFKKFESLLQKVGCAVIGQSEKIAPADKILYAIRDVTATIECVPLITASILSKKIAEGTESLVLDVKVGNGAFMKSREQARKLAKSLTSVAKKMGLPCRALLTQMDQPLGYAVGNALEIEECISVLKCEKSTVYPQLNSLDLKELTLQLCAHMLALSKTTPSLAEGRKLALKRLSDGSAWKKFQEWIVEQGGQAQQILHPELLPRAKHQVEWKSKKRGYLNHIDTTQMGRILIELGGGRKKAEDVVNPAVGLIFHKKLGEAVKLGETLVTVHSDTLDLSEIEASYFRSIEITPSRKPVPKLIEEII